ncbi:hypothetical protein NQ272_26805, partial [Escherichia coli]|nr:hypothetical protein [Escherichia coli]
LPIQPQELSPGSTTGVFFQNRHAYFLNFMSTNFRRHMHSDLLAFQYASSTTLVSVCFPITSLRSLVPFQGYLAVFDLQGLV